MGEICEQSDMGGHLAKLVEIESLLGVPAGLTSVVMRHIFT